MTLRTLLAMTTALAISIPAAGVAQTDARETVQGVLEDYGYDVSELDRLTNSQVAEIYLVATSEDSNDLRVLLSSMDLTDMDMADFERDGMVDDRVRTVLAENGYEPSALQYMSETEIAQIYLAATSSNDNDIGSQLDAMDLAPMGEMADAADIMEETSGNIDRVVASQMAEMGYSQEQIDALSSEETAEVYLSMTSEDATAVRTAIDGALQS